jgi:hypothetical protein
LKVIKENMRIIVVRPSGSTELVQVEPTNTIKELKSKIGSQLGINIKECVLNYGTLVLDEQTDGKTVEDIDLEDEGMIHLTAVFKGGFLVL